MRIILAFCLIFSTDLALAQEFKDSITHIQRKLELCMSDSNASFAIASRICILDATDDLLIQMGNIQGPLLEEVNEDGKLKIMQSQDAWSVYFERETMAIYHMREERKGTMYLNIQVNERYELALTRAKHLANTLWLYKDSRQDQIEK
jgi:hypothetical protein